MSNSVVESMQISRNPVRKPQELFHLCFYSTLVTIEPLNDTQDFEPFNDFVRVPKGEHPENAFNGVKILSEHLNHKGYRDSLALLAKDAPDDRSDWKDRCKVADAVGAPYGDPRSEYETHLDYIQAVIKVYTDIGYHAVWLDENTFDL